MFALKEPIENNDGVVTFKKVDQTIKNVICSKNKSRSFSNFRLNEQIDKVSIKIESDQKYFASIKSIQVLGNKGQEFMYVATSLILWYFISNKLPFSSKKLTTLKSGKEIFLRDESKGRSNSKLNLLRFGN